MGKKSPNLFQNWKTRTQQLKLDTYTCYFACRDPRTPWHVRLLLLLVVGYALSPIDLIPDWIPVVGYLDDLLLLPIGILLVVKLLPPDCYADSKIKAQQSIHEPKPVNHLAGVVIIAIWVSLATISLLALLHWLSKHHH